MGQKIAKMCRSCFNSETEPSQEAFLTKNYDLDPVDTSVTTQPNEIPGFDYKELLKLYSQAKINLFNISKEDIGDYDTIYDKENCKIYSREDTEGYVLRYTWNIPYSPDQFMNFMDEFEIRKKWDTNIDTLSIIGNYSEKEYICYTRFKKFIMLDPRETLVFSKKTIIDGVLALLSVSVESEDYPVEKNIVRAKVIGGLYAENIEDDGKGNTTKITIISHMDVGLSKTLNNIVRKYLGTSIPPQTKKIVAEMKKY